MREDIEGLPHYGGPFPSLRVLYPLSLQNYNIPLRILIVSIQFLLLRLQISESIFQTLGFLMLDPVNLNLDGVPLLPARRNTVFSISQYLKRSPG